MSEPLALEFRDVSITYRTREGAVPAVRGVSLGLPAGSSLGIAGESGSGKSTLFSTVLRLQPKSATVTGEVLVEGEDVQTMSFKRLRALRWAEASIVFQGALHGLDPIQRIGTQIAEPITLHEPTLSSADVDRRVGDLLEQVGLPAARARAYPHQLSGGQRQRVMIAMALACRPRIIVADEPTTALDVMVQAQVLTVLTDLVRELGLTLVLISHDLSVLADVCQRAVVMYAGQLVEVGPSAAVFERGAHPYSAALAGAFPRIGDQRFRYAPSGLPGDPPFPGDVGQGCTFAPRCPHARPDCRTGQIPLVELSPGRSAACRYPWTGPDGPDGSGSGGSGSALTGGTR
jgi:peptide/nickel transport system ATP-binding protein